MIKGKGLGVSKGVKKWAETKIKSDSDWAKETQRRLRERVNWEHIDLNIYTSGQTLNAVHTAVANGKDYWLKFMHWAIPTGMTARIVMNSVLRFKIYKADGTELGRNVRLMLSLGKVGKALPCEISPFLYSSYYDETWLAQLNRDVRDSLVVDISPSVEALFWEGEQIQLWVKNSSVDLPSTPHSSSLIAFPVQVITNADLARQIAKIKQEIMKERGIDAGSTGFEISQEGIDRG